MFKIISIDDEKESISGYSPEDADKFHEKSAKITNKKFDQELKKIKRSKQKGCFDVWRKHIWKNRIY